MDYFAKFVDFLKSKGLNFGVTYVSYFSELFNRFFNGVVAEECSEISGDLLLCVEDLKEAHKQIGMKQEVIDDLSGKMIEAGAILMRQQEFIKMLNSQSVSEEEATALKERCDRLEGENNKLKKCYKNAMANLDVKKKECEIKINDLATDIMDILEEYGLDR